MTDPTPTSRLNSALAGRYGIEREGQLVVDEAVRIARNVGEALDYVHLNDIIHRPERSGW